MLSHFSHIRFFATLWTTALQAPLFMGFSRQGYWSELPCHPPGDLPNPGIKPMSPVSPALQADSLPAEPPGKPTCLSLFRKIYQQGHCKPLVWLYLPTCYGLHVNSKSDTQILNRSNHFIFQKVMYPQFWYQLREGLIILMLHLQEASPILWSLFLGFLSSSIASQASCLLVWIFSATYGSRHRADAWGNSGIAVLSVTGTYSHFSFYLLLTEVSRRFIIIILCIRKWEFRDVRMLAWSNVTWMVVPGV